MPILVTNCTARKRTAATVLAMSSEMVGSSCAATISNWRRALADHQSTRPAKDVYVGRAIVDALSAAQSANGNLFFVSAGLGIVAENVRPNSCFDERRLLGSAFETQDLFGRLVDVVIC